jgi:hypothetical protein
MELYLHTPKQLYGVHINDLLLFLLLLLDVDVVEKCGKAVRDLVLEVPSLILAPNTDCLHLWYSSVLPERFLYSSLT